MYKSNPVISSFLFTDWEKLHPTWSNKTRKRKKNIILKETRKPKPTERFKREGTETQKHRQATKRTLQLRRNITNRTLPQPKLLEDWNCKTTSKKTVTNKNLDLYLTWIYHVEDSRNASTSPSSKTTDSHLPLFLCMHLNFSDHLVDLF